MTTCRKIGIYTNAVTICIKRSQHEANKQSMNRRRVRRKRRKLLNSQQKVKLVYSKQKSVWSKNSTHIQHREYNIDNDTECWVYFNARYTDPNLRYDENTDSWFHYSTLDHLESVVLNDWTNTDYSRL